MWIIWFHLLFTLPFGIWVGVSAIVRHRRLDREYEAGRKQLLVDALEKLEGKKK